MKKLFLFAALVAAMASTEVDAQTKKADKKKVEEVTYSVNIHCEDCKNRIEKNIPFQKGVKDVEVSMASHQVTVQYLASKTDAESIKEALEKMDFVVEDVKPKAKK